MRIAVTHEAGQVFQHFGHTQEFKVYEVEDGKVLSSEVVGSDGQGHGALAALLDGWKVDLLICGGIGGGARAALAEHGVQVVSGAQGSADEAVAAWLAGGLEDAGETCDHHHGEGHDCGHHDHDGACEGSDEGCEGGCGGGCGEQEDGCEGGCGGGGCGGCHGAPAITGKNVGKRCRVHYRGTFDDGTQFDSSYDRGEPLEFVCGAGMMILGFDAAVAQMEVGEKVQVHLMPEEAYGPRDPRAIIQAEIARMSGAERLAVGEQVYLQNMQGQPFLVKVVAKDDRIITFDANHEMAGKELNFAIELVEVSDLA